MTSTNHNTVGNPTPLLEIMELSFTHVGQSQPTLKNACLTLNAGELVVLAGATGSGKSTLLNCITGISPEHTGGKLTGQVFYCGREITTWSIRQRARFMGIVLQNVETQLFTERVREEIVFGLENWNVPPKEFQELARTALIDFDLMGQQDWTIRQLSAGQKQRLLLACLLTRHPHILLLDEPFAFLDTAGVHLLLQLLQKRLQQGQGVLLIEHRLELLRGLSDRAYRLDAGGISPWNLSKLPVPIHPSSKTSFPAEGLSSEPDSMALLQTQNLSWGGYPPFPELQVFARDIVLLRGDNGCGKTTLLKLLSGLLKPRTGWLQIQGRDATRQSVVQIAQTIGFVLQNPNHQLFAESVVAEVMQPGVPPHQAQQLLEQLNLSHCADKHPHALSQGQKRRLALGAVLARQPQICLLDEIMVGQDATSLELMLTTLKIFTNQGGTLIFTSHDPGVAAVLQPRVIALQ
jgi:energy-coupling factor transport system ATP-binding protein